MISGFRRPPYLLLVLWRIYAGYRAQVSKGRTSFFKRRAEAIAVTLTRERGAER